MICRIGVVWLAIVAAGCEGTPSTLPDATLALQCPSEAIEDGEPCALAPEVRCLVDAFDCALAEVCQCAGGVYVCAAPDFDAACDDIENAQCSIEGVHGCYQHPTSGARWCEGDGWQVEYSCPPGCPGPDAVPPEPGDPCTVAAGEVCIYQTSECECVAGAFRCCDAAPCT